MTVTPAEGGAAPPARKARVSRWNSPWLNSKLLIGFSMVLVVMLMPLYGPLIWDVTLARVASSPLNLPPPWAPGVRQAAREEAAMADATATPAPTQAPAATPAPAATSAPGATSIGGALTGGNPFQQQNQEQPATEGGGATDGGESGTSTGGALTGGNPFQQQNESAAEEESAAEAAPAATEAAPKQPPQPTSIRRFGEPTWDHPLGTESNGRDMFAVLLVDAPRSLWIGIIAAGIGILIGIILGFTAGFLGGWVDTVIRILSDSMITIPALAVLIVIAAFVSFNNITYMALMLALFAWPGPTRLIRSQVLSMRERGYVQMARLSGASVFSIMFGEMMPNLLPYLAASFTGNVSAAILAATGLEVLGLGPTRIPTLGITIFYAIRAAAILRGMWWWWGVPIVALIVIFSGLFLMTVGLDEVANPRLRGAKPQ